MNQIHRNVTKLTELVEQMESDSIVLEIKRIKGI